MSDLRALFEKMAGAAAAGAYFDAAPPRSALEQLQQDAARAYRNYAVLARGDGNTLLEIIGEQRGWTRAERDAAATLWANHAAKTYAAARKLAGIDT